MFEIKIEGLDKAAKQLREFPRRVLPALQRAVYASAFILADESKLAVTTGYTRAFKSGQLRGQLIPRDFTSDGLQASIYPLVKYGLLVHEGLGSHKNKGPRPFFKVAAENAGEEVQDIFEDAIKEALS